VLYDCCLLILQIAGHRVVPQSVKDVAQGLVDDGDIMLDKVGTTNYYWSFPSQTLITVR